MLTYARTVSKGEIWLPAVAALAHADAVHMLLDVTVLLSLYLVELSLGTVRYVEACAEVFLLAVVMQMWVYWACGRFLRRGILVHLRSIGTTSYLIGLLVMHAQREDYFEFILYKGLRVHASNAPMFVYILSRCIARDASVLGHLLAGLAGWIVGSDGLAFLHGYWFVCLCSWVLLATLVSLKETTYLRAYLGCMRVKIWPPWEDRRDNSGGGREGSEGDNGDDGDNGNSDNENDIERDSAGAGAAITGGSRRARETPFRTVVDHEPFIQWVAASRISLALARNQAMVDAAESKEIDGQGAEEAEVRAGAAGSAGGAVGFEDVKSQTSHASTKPDVGTDEILSEDDYEVQEEVSLLGGAAGGGESKRHNHSSRVQKALRGLRRHGTRRGTTERSGGSSKYDMDPLDDFV